MTSFPAGWDCHVHVFDADAPVRPGHYRPVPRPLAEIEALAAAHGIGHLVLVQPSVYGNDHGVLLRALDAGSGRHRGVAVVDADVSDTELDRLHAAGVRGIRFNRVSPAGHAGPLDAVADAWRRLAPRLRERGWHVQWYLPATELPWLAALPQDPRVPVVLDHLAGLGTSLAEADPAWDAARALAESGAWVKLSGWYRLGAAEPYAALQPALRRVLALFGARCVWGSDWPHTSFDAAALPRYETMLAPLRGALDAAALNHVLGDAAGALYDLPAA